jgi:fibronectin-binding autotransporter adhesin
VLLLNGNAGLTGSLQLKNGSTLGGTLASATIGAVPSTGTIDVPAGAVTTVAVYDYFVRSTNGLNLVVNHKLTGSGTIDMTGIEYAAGYNGGGIFQLRNPGNDFSGAINIGTNTILEASPNDADLSGNTFGTATLNLNGGVLRVRDQANNLAGAETISYANNVTLNASSLIDVDRLGSVATNKTIAFGTLTIPGGAPVLSTVYGTGAPITGNGYRASFTQVAGPGTLVKGGSRFIDIDGYAAGFSGNIEVEGPQGLSLPTSGNLTLNAATNAINKLTVRGFHTFAAGKTVTIADTLEVGNNAGEVANGLNGLSTGGIVGSVTLNSTSAVSANLVRNRGIIAADNSPATLASAAFVGSGLYQAYGQSLTLNGTFADDGASPTTIRSAGTAGAAVVLTSAGSANTGGAEVQAGILRVAPTGGTATNPLGTGSIRVLGAPATTLGAGSQPVAAQTATLEFAGTAITQNGGITNSGTVRVSSGVTTINGTIQGTPSVPACWRGVSPPPAACRTQMQTGARSRPTDRPTRVISASSWSRGWAK